MSETNMSPLKILVERAVRPVRASSCLKRKLREELLAHVTSVFEEEQARLASDGEALEATARRFGDPAELTAQLQESVPTLDAIPHFADWVAYQPHESTLSRAVRYTILIEAVAVLLLFTMLLLLRGRFGELPPETVWHSCPVLLLSGYLGFTICVLESSLRRSRCEQTANSWLRFTLLLVGLTVVSMPVGLLTYGVSLVKTIWVFVFTVGIPVGLAWGLSYHFTARSRYHDDWASLRIE